MRYESAKTPRGNIGVSYESQAAADAQAAAMDCKYCTGVLRWEGRPATRLIALNGLRWPVAVSADQIQIGCQCHESSDWERFSDAEIYRMDRDDALAFWAAYKTLILSLPRGASND